MFKQLIALSALVIATVAGPIPTADQAKAEMIAAGISSQAADGIIALAPDFSNVGQDREAARAAFQNYISQVDAYIKTQSPEDQAAFEKFTAEKKALAGNDAKANLLSSGMSTEAAEGVMKVAVEFFTSGNASDFGQLASQVDAYIKTQSPEDQAAFEKFTAEQKAKHQ